MQAIRWQSTCVIAIVLTVGIAVPASAQSNRYLKARCTQLTSFFDYDGVSRGESSDGARKWRRIRAGID